MSKKKKILICLAAVTLLCFISIALLLFFNRNKVKNGFAIEILTGTTEFNNRVFHLQNGEFTKVGMWRENFTGGTSNSFKMELCKKLETHLNYQYMDQLDDRYIGEDYLFNHIGSISTYIDE